MPGSDTVFGHFIQICLLERFAVKKGGCLLVCGSVSGVVISVRKYINKEEISIKMQHGANMTSVMSSLLSTLYPAHPPVLLWLL